MYRGTKTLILAAAILAVSATLALAQAGPALWNGTQWKDMTMEVKVAYIKGIGNMADFEVATGGTGRAMCVSKAFVDELKNKSISSIIQEVDKYYKDNPGKLNSPVIEVVLRTCTTLCPPEAPAAGKAPKK